MKAADWAPLLAGVDAVVNCAGALQDSPRDNLRAVHVTAVSALAEACKTTGVKRFVQISAVGVQRGKGRFQRTKQAADQALQASELDWIILRPALVLAPAAYGGSALLRGLAAFPGLIPALHADALVQTVSVEDVAEAAARSVRPETPPRFVCDLAAAEQTRLRDILEAIRGWLGLAPAPLVAIPSWIGALGAGVADALAWLGWRSPMRSAALQQLAAEVVGRAEEAEAHLGFRPRRLAETLANWPSGVQDRWYSRLYFLKPLTLAMLAAFWAVSGLIGFASRAAAVRLLTDAGMADAPAAAFVFAGSVVDLALAAAVCLRRTTAFALKGMVLVTAVYLAGASLWTPGLWRDPLGPLVKSLPAAVLALVALAMLDER
jgi:uncharacterized protein YbjT (DUF2867 family)